MKPVQVQGSNRPGKWDGSVVGFWIQGAWDRKWAAAGLMGTDHFAQRQVRDGETENFHQSCHKGALEGGTRRLRVPELVEILIGNLQESGFLVKLILFLCLKFVPGCYFSVEFLWLLLSPNYTLIFLLQLCIHSHMQARTAGHKPCFLWSKYVVCMLTMTKKRSSFCV